MKIQTVGIIGAMQPEIDYLKSRLQRMTVHRWGDFEVYEGYLGAVRVALSLSGIGKVNAAVATALLVNHFAPDCVINTGSAGGLAAGLKVSDVVIGVQTAHHDVDVTAFGYVPGQVPQLPPRFEADAALAAVVQRAAASLGERVWPGLIVSGDQFICSTEKSAWLRTVFSDVLAVEMEAAAIAQTCWRLAVPFVVVRVLSDTADEQADVSFEQFIAEAGMRSGKMVEAVVADLSESSYG